MFRYLGNSYRFVNCKYSIKNKYPPLTINTFTMIRTILNYKCKMKQQQQI